MAPQVNLTVTEGILKGKTFRFDGHTLCTVGRSDDCFLHLPNNYAHCTVSRHHCHLDIDPPVIRVRDLGSLNGTFVNGRNIGHRGKRLTPEQASFVGWPELTLKDGDELRVGDTVLRIGIVPRAGSVSHPEDPASCPRSASFDQEWAMSC
jgi:pSer/pThr/pTyr-binding forkhead associated (FHA) protein